jgi:hypothetical protein
MFRNLLLLCKILCKKVNLNVLSQYFTGHIFIQLETFFILLEILLLLYGKEIIWILEEKIILPEKRIILPEKKELFYLAFNLSP